MKRLFIACLVLLPVIALYLFFNKKIADDTRRRSAELVEFSSKLREMQDQCIRAIPIYDDFSGKSESEKRRFPYEYHIAQARKTGTEVATESELQKYVAEGKYVPLQEGKGYYCYGVPQENRFLTKGASDALDEISERFSGKIREKGVQGTVKIALSSAVRWKEYQVDLRKKNGNAIDESSHSYGVSFDIFFDDYFAFPDFDFVLTDSSAAASLRKTTGFILGDSLRRQFKTILAEVLSAMQSENKIVYIYEFRQRCFHVTAVSR